MDDAWVTAPTVHHRTAPLAWEPLNRFLRRWHFFWKWSDRSVQARDMTHVCTAPNPSDAELVDRLRAGRADALGPLYIRYGADIRRLVLRLDPTADASTADDICQTVFLTFLDTLSRYEERGRLRSWLFGITTRQCRARRRRWWNRFRIHRRAGTAAAGVAPAGASVEQRIEARQAIEQILERLPDAQREVLVLHHLEGMSIPEIAVAIDVSENAVSTRLYRARRAMEVAR